MTTAIDKLRNFEMLIDHIDEKDEIKLTAKELQILIQAILQINGRLNNFITQIKSIHS